MSEELDAIRGQTDSSASLSRLQAQNEERRRIIDLIYRTTDITSQTILDLIRKTDQEPSASLSRLKAEWVRPALEALVEAVIPLEALQTSVSKFSPLGQKEIENAIGVIRKALSSYSPLKPIGDDPIRGKVDELRAENERLTEDAQRGSEACEEMRIALKEIQRQVDRDDLIWGMCETALQPLSEKPK